MALPRRCRGVAAAALPPSARLRDAKAAEVFEAKGLHVLPGVIDTQVHFREPGNEHKEDLDTRQPGGGAGRRHGVFEMPNTNPPTTTRAAIEDKLARAKGRMHCDHAFYAGATPPISARWRELERMPGVCGVKAFLGSSTGTLLLNQEDDILAALKSGHAPRRGAFRRRRPPDRAQASGRCAAIRDPSGVARCRNRARCPPSACCAWRGKPAAGCMCCMSPPATKLPLLAAAQDIATAETTPQHLTLAAPECYERLGTYAQMNPPIRDASHREALWAAVREGVIDVIGSDHAPHTREEKDKTYPDTPSGMPGVQTLATILLDHVNAGRSDAGALCRSHQRGRGSASSASPARAASRAAMTPTSPSSI